MGCQNVVLVDVEPLFCLYPSPSFLWDGRVLTVHDLSVGTTVRAQLDRSGLERLRSLTRRPWRGYASVAGEGAAASFPLNESVCTRLQLALVPTKHPG